MNTKDITFLKRFGDKNSFRPRFHQGYTIDFENRTVHISVDGYSVGMIPAEQGVQPKVFSLYGWVEEEEFHENSWKWVQDNIPTALGTEYDSFVKFKANDLKEILLKIKSEITCEFVFLPDSLVVLDKDHNVVGELSIGRYDALDKFTRIWLEPKYILGFLRALKPDEMVMLAQEDERESSWGVYRKPYLFTQYGKDHYRVYLMPQSGEK